MSASLKKGITPDAATAELWRVAESGDAEELVRILPRVRNVNARNQHGMTALMRAAYHGHVPVVRALLDRGADPNLTRNDKFTALALAAFFGHTETVRLLIEHGAKTEVVTRCGASAKTWAAARTYDEVAHCLETYTPAARPAVVKPLKRPSGISDQERMQEVPAQAPAVVKTLKQPPEIWELVPPVQNIRTRTPAAVKTLKDPVETTPAAVKTLKDPVETTPAAVKTLKDPPEIWDLVPPVQVVPIKFNARSRFLSRLGLSNGSMGLRVAAVFVIAVACVVGALVLRGSRPHSVQAEVSSPAPESKAPVVEKVESAPSEAPVNSSATEVSELPAVDPVRNHGTHKPPALPRQTRSRATVVSDVVENTPSREAPAPPPPPVIAMPKTEPRSTAKAKGELSPQLITPAKSAAPKAKVIQWP